MRRIAAVALRDRGAGLRRARLARRRALPPGAGPRCWRSSTARIAVTARALTRGAIATHPPAGRICSRRATRCSTSASRSRRWAGRRSLGSLISEVGLSAALLADAASFVVIAIVLAVTRDLPAPQGERAARRSSASASGLAFARREPRVRLLLGGQSRRADPLHADHPHRGDLREGEPRTTSAGLRRAARLVGRRDRRRQHPLRRACGNALRAGSSCSRPPRSASRTSAWPSRRASSVRVPALRARRHRQRHPVGVGHDRAAGGDAAGLPGARRRPARVGARGDARRRLPDRRRSSPPSARRAPPTRSRASARWCSSLVAARSRCAGSGSSYPARRSSDHADHRPRGRTSTARPMRARSRSRPASARPRR